MSQTLYLGVDPLVESVFLFVTDLLVTWDGRNKSKGFSSRIHSEEYIH